MTKDSRHPRHAVESSERKWLWVTEVLKVFTIRRNIAAACLGLSAALGTPWILMLAFGWLSTQGVHSSPIEVIALANRNQGGALLLMILLGLQSYLSDAYSGLFLGELVESRCWRRGPAGAKLAFGAIASAFLTVCITASNYLAWVILREGVAEPAQRGELVAFWLISPVALFLAMLLNYLFGLLVASIIRNRGLAVAVGVAAPWLVGTVMMNAVRFALPDLSVILEWVLPSELINATCSWVPGGSQILAVNADNLAFRLVLMGLWVALGATSWVFIVQHRYIYPSDQA